MSAYAEAWASIREALSRERKGRSTVRETDFLPAALEVVERPVSPFARRTAYVLLAGMLVLVLWLIFGRIDIVAAAEGRLEPTQHIQNVQPPIDGIVRRLHVREGQRVVKGQLLAELDPTMTGAELDQGRAALLAAELAAARSRAVLSALDGRGFAFVPPLSTPPQMAAEHRALAQAQFSQIQAFSGNSLPPVGRPPMLPPKLAHRLAKSAKACRCSTSNCAPMKPFWKRAMCRSCGSSRCSGNALPPNGIVKPHCRWQRAPGQRLALRAVAGLVPVLQVEPSCSRHWFQRKPKSHNGAASWQRPRAALAMVALSPLSAALSLNWQSPLRAAWLRPCGPSWRSSRTAASKRTSGCPMPILPLSALDRWWR